MPVVALLPSTQTSLMLTCSMLSCTAAVEISVTKDAVKFGTTGDIGSANIMCRCVCVSMLVLERQDGYWDGGRGTTGDIGSANIMYRCVAA